MPQLVWLESAWSDLRRLHTFIKEQNPQAALNALKQIKKISSALERFPDMGIPLAGRPGYRELFIPFGAGAYVLRYRLSTPDKVVIVRVWHSRELRHD